jgi:outer membrane protein TolC
MQEYETAVANLARLVRLDPLTPLLPTEDFRVPMPMPCGALANEPTEQLVRTALNNRPELGENRALVAAALQQVKLNKARPFLPTATTTLSWGDFGGGPDLNPPFTTIVNGKPTTITNAGFGHYGIIDHFEPRMDFEAILTWRLRNFGLGNRADLLERQAIYRQANWRLLAVQDRVVTQVVQAQEDVQAWRDRLGIVRASLFNAQDQPAGPVFTSVRLNLERITGGAGRPLEALDAIRSLSDQLEFYGQAVTDYERSQFRLLIALGMPPPALLNCVTPAAPPLPPPSSSRPLATLGVPDDTVQCNP